ncbi:hypothetical protein WJX82_009165 [Trebouxia sp. C0006]
MLVRLLNPGLLMNGRRSQLYYAYARGGLLERLSALVLDSYTLVNSVSACFLDKICTLTSGLEKRVAYAFSREGRLHCCACQTNLSGQPFLLHSLLKLSGCCWQPQAS